jgi:hypothetical protein
MEIHEIHTCIGWGAAPSGWNRDPWSTISGERLKIMHSKLQRCNHRNLRSYAEEACLKKGEYFSADLHTILWSEARFCRPLKICSFEVNLVLGGDQPISYKVFSTPKYLQDLCQQLIFVKSYNCKTLSCNFW